MLEKMPKTRALVGMHSTTLSNRSTELEEYDLIQREALAEIPP